MTRFPDAHDLIQRHDLLPQGAAVGIAVSGGADSMGLLDLLADLASASRLRLVVVHLDHGFRPDAADDARFVADAARARGIPFHGGKIEILAKGNLEALARRARYGFFAEVASRLGLERIALGHTADDQVETLLERLLRGAGRTGLAAMQPIRDAEGVLLLRPFLSTSREAIRVDLAARGISHREDPMKQDTRFTRVRIRQEILPHLRTLSPGLDEILLRTAEVLGEEEAFLARLADEALVASLRPVKFGIDRGETRLDRAVLRRVPRPVLRRCLRAAAARTAGAAAGAWAAGHRHLEAIEELLGAGRTGDHLHLPLGLSVHLEREHLVFTPARETGPAPVPEVEVAVPGITRVDALGIVVAAARHPRSEVVVDLARASSAAILDAESIRGAIRVRTRRDGDRMTPLGMTGSKKLQDLLSDAKIPRRLRDAVPILVDDEGILWAAGVRQADRTRVGPETREVVRIEIRTLEEPGPEEAA